MKARCLNKNHKRYKHYGGRGITYDPRWEIFQKFYEDMGKSYKEGLSLDRIDNDKGYYKENCRWATPVQQANNRRGNFSIEFEGKKYNSREFEKKFKIGTNTIRYGLKKNPENPEEVLRQYLTKLKNKKIKKIKS